MRREVNFRSAPNEMQPVSFAARMAAADKTTLHAKGMITKTLTWFQRSVRFFSLLLLLLDGINYNIMCITILNYHHSSYHNTLYN